MKKTEKSGHQKRLESKKRALKECASAVGQKSILSMFGKRDSDTVEVENAAEVLEEGLLHDESSPPSSKVAKSDTTNVITENAKQQDEFGTHWYKGKKLDLNWLIMSESCLEVRYERKDKRQRPIMKCLVCNQLEMHVRRFTVNGRIPVAQGIRVDGKDRLRLIVDHLCSAAHEEALRLKKLDDAWKDMSDAHPWVRIVKKCKAETLQLLLKLAVDVYNDCRVETVSAWSWASRSLSGDHSNNLLHIFRDNGWDADFVPYNQPGSAYHYRDPMTYAEMREIISEHEMKKVADLLKECVCYSVQIDGSSDKQQVDFKFITARFLPQNEVSVKTVFLGISSSDLGGADGLLDALTTCLKSVGVDTEKLVGITTDGENANTGKNGGLWKLLKDYTGKELLTAWCICHRSDLALESVQSEVPELSLWMTNVLAVSKFFRQSPRRVKYLHKEDPKCLTFPKHFEVRFAEHTLNVLKAVLNNLEAAKQVWTKMCSGEIHAEKIEKRMAQGFLDKWKHDGQQFWLTTLMFDLCKIFKNLQKIFQKSHLILLDIITARDAAVENLKVMNEMPIPGGREEKCRGNFEEVSSPTNSRQKRNIMNKYVTTTHRNDMAVRTEIVQSAINFLDERMNLENDGTLKSLMKILDAKSSTELITASRDLASQLFGPEKIEDFVSDTCMSWRKIVAIEDPAIEDNGTFYALRLRKMVQASCGLLKTFLASFLTLTPHSMGTERTVSHYNNIKTSNRASLSQQSINSIMHISLNGKGTAFFDPRNAVAEFLKRKERRDRQPEQEIYQTRSFIKKFFQKDNGCL